MEVWKSKMVKVSDLKENPDNPRDISDHNYNKLKTHIETYGFTGGLKIDSENMVLSGNQRLRVLKELKIEELEVFYPPRKLTKKEKVAIIQSENEHFGVWIEELRMEQLEEVGLTIEEISSTVEEIDGVENEIEEDDFEPDPEKATDIKEGDIFNLGNHRLMCGDSTKSDEVAKLMCGKKANMVFTDPPWNVNYGAVEEGNDQGYKPRTILNDFMGTEDFKEFMDGAFSSMADNSEPGCPTYVVMSAQEWGNMMLTLASNEYHWSSTIIWNKSHSVLSRKDYNTKYEPIWYGWLEGKARLHPIEDHTQCDVWDIARPTKSELHPTTKPIEVPGMALKNSSKKGDLVLDLFGGSGSTLIACDQLERNCCMMELDPKYCQVIIDRWELHTGNTAEFIENINNGKED